MKYKIARLDSFSDTIKVRLRGTNVWYDSLTQAMRTLKALGYDSVYIDGDTYSLRTQRFTSDSIQAVG